MAKSFTVKARLEAEDRASGTLDRVQGRFSRLGGYLSRSFVVTLGDVTRLFGSVTSAIGGMVSASAEQERAVKALDAALIGLGSSAAGVSTALQDQATALQKTTRFGDEAIVNGQALLATYTQNEEQIKRSTQAAVDFAAATGRDLNTAFLLLSKAAAGNTAELSRYGIVIDENVDSADKFASVLTKMNDQFGGRAAADVDTYSGALAQLSNAFSDLQETAGDAVTQNERVRDSLQDLTKVLQSEGVIDSVSTFTGEIVEFVTGASALWIKRVSDMSLGLRAMFGDQKAAALIAKEVRDAFAAEALAMDGVTEAEEALAIATDAATDAMLRQQRAQKALDETTKTFTEAVHEMGITLEEDVNKEMEKNAELMEQAETLYRRGVITRQDFERVQRAVADANDEATESLLEQVDAFGELTSATGSSAEGFESFRRSVRDTRSELDSFSATSARAASSQSKFAANAITGGKSSYSTISGGQFSQQPGTTRYVDDRGRLRFS